MENTTRSNEVSSIQGRLENRSGGDFGAPFLSDFFYRNACILEREKEGSNVSDATSATPRRRQLSQGPDGRTLRRGQPRL